MATRLTYTRPHLLSALHDQLIAAGIHPDYLGDDAANPDGIVMDVPNGTSEPAVAAVVNAHSKATAQAAYDAARQAETDDDAAIKQGVATLLNDATALVALADELEGAGALTTAQLRARMGAIARGLARTDRMLAALGRVVARRT